jgi:hypothetical protein
VCVSSGDYIPPKYTVNLDLPAEERWIEIFTDFKEPILKIADLAMSSISTFEYYAVAYLLRA